MSRWDPFSTSLQSVNNWDAACSQHNRYMQVNPGLPTEMPRTDPPTSAETVSLLLNNTVSILGAEKLVTPDDLRGSYASLREALGDLGPEQFWPDVDTLRGKMLIIAGGEAPQLFCLVCNALFVLHWKESCAA